VSVQQRGQLVGCGDAHGDQVVTGADHRAERSAIPAVECLTLNWASGLPSVLITHMAWLSAAQSRPTKNWAGGRDI
jgi:hypothetical protein